MKSQFKIFWLVPKYVKIKIYKTIVLNVFYGLNICSLTLSEWNDMECMTTGCQGEYLDQKNCLLRSLKVVFCS
jgi:hypothetical protein